MASTAEKTAVDAGKNGPVPTGVFSLPEAGKVRRTALKGLDFLTVYTTVYRTGSHICDIAARIRVKNNKYMDPQKR